jgi:hypothetical protein
LGTIRTEGVPAYLQRISQPYLAAAAQHLHPSSGTHTQRWFGRFLELLRRKRRENLGFPPAAEAARNEHADEQGDFGGEEGRKP